MNPVEIGLAFIEGLALIASPCILPVLPLVLSASADGGKSRPFGIIIGFVLSFSLFAFAARKLVAAFGIDLDIIKDASLLLLFLFGLVLLSSSLSDKFSRWTQGLARLGNKISMSGKDGMISGIVIGALIGLVWTPCAGPILATVLVQVIRQQTDLAGYFIILSFATGSGIPMLIIALAGREIMGKLGFFTRHAEAMRRVFGFLIIASVVFIASGVDAQSLFAAKPASETAGEITHLEDGLDHPYPAPEFAGIEKWLNSQPLTMQNLRGKVVLVDFWTYSCINCVRTLPYITGWDKKYRDKGLVIVGVHSPEFEFEKKADNVTAAIEHHGIHYPVALDNALSTWDSFRNRYWPAHYLISREGMVVYTHFGEGKYDVTENNIRFLLGLKNKAAAEESGMEIPRLWQTPETYLGYERSTDNFSGRDSLLRDKESGYQFPKLLKSDNWALSGKWIIGPEKITAGEKDAALRINFTAQKVYLVLGTSAGKPAHITLSLNGEPAGTITIVRNTLYELIDQKSPKNGLLEIKADDPGVEAYAFTFG